jgi:hypothetical protein
MRFASLLVQKHRKTQDIFIAFFACVLLKAHSPPSRLMAVEPSQIE